MDAAVQPRARRRARGRLRACCEKDGARSILAEASRRALRARSSRASRRSAACKGADLVGRTYEPLFPFFADDGERLPRPRRRRSSSIGEGTGVVHMAPAFGEDDLAVVPGGGHPGRRPGRSSRATSPPRCRPMPGKNVFDANKDIIRDLKARGRGRPPRDLRPQLSALLAHRPAADLQGDAVLVREGHRLPRPHGRAQPGHHLGARARRATASSATGSRTRATGTSAATASGARRSRCGSRDDPDYPAHRRLRLARRARARLRRAPEGPAPARTSTS